jgi:hypothetical protein
MRPSGWSAPVAAAAILAAFVAGWLLMPRIMLMVSGGGRVAGVLVAIAFMLAFFAIFWLRARRQRHSDGN